jgi:signal peptidase II
MMTKNPDKYIKLAIIAGCIVVLDQITKAAILWTLPLNRSISIVPGLFNLIHIQNPGGAFGFMAHQSSAWFPILFLFFTLLALGLIFFLYRNTPPTQSSLATGFAFIFGGAIGNLIDRIRFGKVVDFLDFYIGNMHWPAFNVADSAVSVGIVIFLYHILFKKMPA